MKKILCLGTVFIVTILIAIGCSKIDSFDHITGTGDKVTLSLDTSDGYDFVRGKCFVVECDDEEISTGTFISADKYSDSVEDVLNNDDSKIIKSDANDDFEYIFYNEGKNYNYLVLIKNSKSGVLIENTISEKSAEECFKHLDFKLYQ